jgi:hypothetical protein
MADLPNPAEAITINNFRPGSEGILRFAPGVFG